MKLICFSAFATIGSMAVKSILEPLDFKHYVDEFNTEDEELYQQHISNADSWQFLVNNVPFFHCPEKDLERAYFFRFWTFRKHIKSLPRLSSTPFIITEFLPAVSWAGQENSISCAAGHHYREGRWIYNQTYLDSYTAFWLTIGNPRQYSFWIADSVLQYAAVTDNEKLLSSSFRRLEKNFKVLRETNLAKTGENAGLYFNTDNRDGMENSIGGWGATRGFRPTLNSYQFGEARALHQMANLFAQNAESSGNSEENKRWRGISTEYEALANNIRSLVENNLWDGSAIFYKVKSYRDSNSSFVDVRELIGYTPWYFDLPRKERNMAWCHLLAEGGFHSRYGLCTAEQRHPKFAVEYSKSHECLWNGPVWPYSTSITLSGLANSLQDAHVLRSNDGRKYISAHKIPRGRKCVSRQDYYDLLLQYARSHRRTRTSSEVIELAQRRNCAAADVAVNISWIDENINPYTGDWISRTLLREWRNGTWSAQKGGKERGKDYNHSTFCDLIISGLVGLRPSLSRDEVVVNPLLARLKHHRSPWPYFCLDGVLYHGRYITIYWDSTGLVYRKGQGFHVLVDGNLQGWSAKLEKLTVALR